jgi:hypothetical protein
MTAPPKLGFLLAEVRACRSIHPCCTSCVWEKKNKSRRVCIAGDAYRCSPKLVGLPAQRLTPETLSVEPSVAATGHTVQVTLPELRRHKRAFMKLATNLTWNRVQDAATARRMFVDYLRQQLAQA